MRPKIGETITVGREAGEPTPMVVVGHDIAGNPVVEAIKDNSETDTTRRRIAPRMGQLSSVGIELGV